MFATVHISSYSCRGGAPMPLDNFLDFLEQQDPDLVTTALAIAATDSDDAAMKQVGIDVAEFRKRSDRIAMIRATFLRIGNLPPRAT